MTALAHAPFAGQETAPPTARFRHVATALALPGAFVLVLASNVLYAVASTGNAGDTGTGAQTIEFYREHTDALRAATLLAMLGCLLAVPGLLAALRWVFPHKPRLGLWSVVLMVAGYISYFGIVTTNFDTVALARSPLTAEEAGDILEHGAMAEPLALAFFALFVVGNLLGTALLGLAVILARGLPTVAGVLVLGWPVGHALNVFAGLGEWFAVGGGALEIAGFAWLAWRARG